MSMPDRVIVTASEHHGDQTTQQQASGPPEIIAAWLRALANLYDPPKPAMRGTDGLRTAYGPVGKYDGPGTRAVHVNDSFGFAPAKAESEAP